MVCCISVTMSTVLAIFHIYFLQFYFCPNADDNISAQPPGSVRVIKNGFYLSISPVTAANQGKYTCLVIDKNAEMMKTYDITVVGEIHLSF